MHVGSLHLYEMSEGSLSQYLSLARSLPAALSAAGSTVLARLRHAPNASESPAFFAPLTRFNVAVTPQRSFATGKYGYKALHDNPFTRNQTPGAQRLVGCGRSTGATDRSVEAVSAQARTARIHLSRPEALTATALNHRVLKTNH
jgi:hypothetical protein